MTRPLRRTLAASVAALSLLVLAGCGGDDAAEKAADSPAGTTGSAPSASPSTSAEPTPSETGGGQPGTEISAKDFVAVVQKALDDATTANITISSQFGGYFRFNVNYQGKNPNFGNFATGTNFRSTPAYAVVDLFAGLAGNKGVWDLGVYAKNAFDKQVELLRAATINTVYTQFAAPAGYDVVSTSRPREIGVQIRYAFGSR